MPRVASLRPDRPGLPKPLDSFDPEQVDDLAWNSRTISTGTAGRFEPERVDAFLRKWVDDFIGIRSNFTDLSFQRCSCSSCLKTH